MESKIDAKFLIDFYTGLGIRQIIVAHDAYEVVKSEEYLRDGWGRTDSDAGTFYRPHLSLGFKIGYLIYSRK
ncbi:MAG: hypothetical protein H0X62_00450 [Bacteroidetes bacterium]|nr:hypothetical protein [Bacteroidota bacterium]